MKPNPRRKALVEAVQAMTPQSGACYARAERVFAGGSIGGGIHQVPWPVYLKRGNGAVIEDVDGNRYLDCSLGSGTLLLGHSHPDIQAALQRQIHDGIMHSGAAPQAVAAAEKLRGFFPCTEKLFFCNSGTEAVQKCIMLARASTRKNRIAKFEGCYHGTYDLSCLSVTQFDGDVASPRPRPMIAGTSAHALDDAVILPFNDERAFALLEAHAAELAAVIVEPVATISLVPMSDDFVLRLRDVTRRLGILLVFDEVLTGFRLGRGGCQSRFNVTPDIAAYGKALGGGTAVGAIGCRERVVADLPNGSPPLRLGGTFSGNPLSMAGTLAALDVMQDTKKFSFDALASRCAHFAATLNARLSSAGLPVSIAHAGSMFHVHVDRCLPRTPRDILQQDRRLLDELWLRLRLSGVYTEAAHTAFLSSAHDDAAVEQLIDRYDTCIAACFA